VLYADEERVCTGIYDASLHPVALDQGAALNGVGATGDVANPKRLDRILPRGLRARQILKETGRLLAYAIDNGVGLYDPEAVLLTGKMSFNDTFWDALHRSCGVSRDPRRKLVRACAIPVDDVNRPIGPRGAAWLGFDTWVFPRLLDGIDPERRAA